MGKGKGKGWVRARARGSVVRREGVEERLTLRISLCFSCTMRSVPHPCSDAFSLRASSSVRLSHACRGLGLGLGSGLG